MIKKEIKRRIEKKRSMMNDNTSHIEMKQIKIEHQPKMEEASRVCKESAKGLPPLEYLRWMSGERTIR